MSKEYPEYLSIDFKNSLKYLLCGQLVADSFIHQTRCIDIPVLIIVKSGILNIDIDGRRYKVKKNEMILLPEQYLHTGFCDKDTNDRLVYFWVHFVINNRFDYNKPCGTDTRLPIYFKLINPARVNILCNQLMDISKTVPINFQYCGFLLDALVCEISSQAKNTLISPNKTVNTAAAWIKLHITEPISLDDTAEEFGYNKRYLARVFKEFMGKSVNKYIEENKIELAKNMLIYSDESISCIAHKAGYEDAGYFMRVFKKNEGMTCTQYRNAYSKINMNKI
ncbi:MAG: helix-turn-helix domain-containing protein [Clostridia bacterium]